MMSGIHALSAASSALGAVGMAGDMMAQARANEALERMNDARAVYDINTHQYRIGEGDSMRLVAAEDWAPSRAAPYRYPSETPANWVAIEDQKDRELSRWIASLGLRRA